MHCNVSLRLKFEPEILLCIRLPSQCRPNNPLHAIGSNPSSQTVRLMTLWRPAICRRRRLCHIMLLTQRRKILSPMLGRSLSLLTIWTGVFHHLAQNCSEMFYISSSFIHKTLDPIPYQTSSIFKFSARFIFKKNPLLKSSENISIWTARMNTPTAPAWNLVEFRFNADRVLFFP